MRARPFLFVAFALAAPAALAPLACGSTADVTEPPPAPDASLDAAKDTGPATDGTGDALPAVDAHADADAEPDAEPDAGPVDDDSGIDRDAAPDAAFDGACPTMQLDLDPDASPGTCGVTPADVACDTADDCTVFTKIVCSCETPIYGMNKASTGGHCPPPPCPAPGPGWCPDAGPGYLAQDCQVVPALGDVGVACVHHVCTTFAAR